MVASDEGVSRRLAELTDYGRAPAGSSGWLRARTLANVAAATGKQVEAARLHRCLPDTFRQTPGGRAFLHAALCHARTQDDFYPPGRVHVGTVVLPAALALLREPERLLPALWAGYEVLTAISEAYGKLAQARGYRPTGFFGPFGAAAAATVAAGYGVDEVQRALAFAAIASSGHNQAWLEGSDEWLVEVAMAARAGVEAAQFAIGGLRNASRPIGGKAGWARAFFDDPGGERLRLLLDGEPVWRTSRVAMKLFPVSGIANPPTALACRLSLAVNPATVENIAVELSESDLAYPGTASTGPFHSRSDALMSVPLCVALAFIHGSIPYEQLMGGADERVAALLSRLQLVGARDLRDGDTRVAVRDASGERRLEGSAGDLLFPDWTQIAGNVEDLARRNEAPLDRVSEAADALASEVPDANRLRELLDDAARTR